MFGVEGKHIHRSTTNNKNSGTRAKIELRNPIRIGRPAHVHKNVNRTYSQPTSGTFPHHLAQEERKKVFRGTKQLQSSRTNPEKIEFDHSINR